uniref:Prefoldin subunit 6 n=1 Tax=Geotrypetes seraphini TaxID=260995 RepID=A0A6P8SD75_GEOSA|nr:prefoldin subunit 6-like [Geotrypetes seraphini]
MAEQIQKKLQGEVKKYQKLQKDFSKCMTAGQTLEAQLTENNILKKELDLLDASNKVFKFIVPVLVAKDFEEAKGTVRKHLYYIGGEIKRYETQMKDLEKKAEEHRNVLTKLQQDFQKAQSKPAVKA